MSDRSHCAAAEPDVDLVVLSQTDGPLPHAVRQAIESQVGVRLHVHRVIGRRHDSDPNRWQTIARARNAARCLGQSPWVMFLDDDVVLRPDTVARLLEGLKAYPAYGAFAADYLGETNGLALTRHVAMGATLFRRSALEQVSFRWSLGRCECQCCCDDLRRQAVGIGYLPGAAAGHLKKPAEPSQPEKGTSQESGVLPAGASRPGHVLVAFDRRHLGKFRRQFLASLRAAGNREQVTVVGYGLYPSEQAVLAATAGLEPVARPPSRAMVPITRLKDFQDVVERWPPDTPVAYWDAADVIFQDRLDDLWTQVHNHPDRLLAAREPKGYPDNRAVAAWSLSIRNSEARTRAFRLLSSRPFLNSGFAAGTAKAMLAYFREAHRLRHSPALDGTRDWGDQMTLNLYCHLNPDAWWEVEEGWNYCVHDRRPGEVRVDASGRVVSTRGARIRVVHGNAHSLRQLEVSSLTWSSG